VCGWLAKLKGAQQGCLLCFVDDGMAWLMWECHCQHTLFFSLQIATTLFSS